MPFHPTRCRRGLIFLGAVLLIGLIGWWVAWRVAASQYNGVVDSWVAQGRQAGYVIAWSDRQLFGFPHRVVLRFKELSWRDQEGISFHAADIDIAASPWLWHKFDVKFKGPIMLEAPLDVPGTGLLLAGEDGTAHVSLDQEGEWRLCEAKLNGARIGRSPDTLFVAKLLQASVERSLHPPADHREAGLIVAGHAEDVALPTSIPPSFGPFVKSLDLNLRVMGDMPDFRKRGAVDAWNKASGVVEFDRLRMEWGPLLIAATGTVGFDDDLQPEGAFSSVIDHHQAVLKALMDNNFIPISKASMLNAALGVFAKPASADGVNGIDVPITVQLGGLFLGPVKVMGFPEIDWPVDVAAPNPPPVSPPAAGPR